MATLVYGGCYVGTIVAFPASGALDSHFGWETIFYVFGGVGINFQFPFSYY
jgi:predicted MFS family arabinose efflux permease